MRALWPGGALALSLAVAGGAGAHEGHKPPPDAGAAASYAFPIPKPGSYNLPPIKPAGGGPVLDETGRPHELADLLRGRATVLAFIYTRCGDICPTATLQMSLLQDLAAKQRGVSERMRLATMSFDPGYDTPAVMAEHAAHWRSQARGAPEWLFLTAPDRESLAPVLSAYNQSLGPKADPASPTGPLQHIFRAFLVDAQGRIRNIYSLDFFDPKLVLNDVETLLLEPRRGRGEKPSVNRRAR
jgi:protein SCO1/2